MIGAAGSDRRAAAPPGLLGLLGRVWALALIALAWALALLAQMTPLGLAPEAVPSPDLAFCALAWAALARPDALPVPAVFGFAVLSDLVMGGPAGGGALGMALGLEGIKFWARFHDRPSRLRDAAAIGLACAGALLVPWILMRLSFAGGPPVGQLGLRWLTTMAALVPVAAAMRYVLQLRRVRLGGDAATSGRTG